MMFLAAMRSESGKKPHFGWVAFKTFYAISGHSQSSLTYSTKKINVDKCFLFLLLNIHLTLFNNF